MLAALLFTSAVAAAASAGAPDPDPDLCLSQSCRPVTCVLASVCVGSENLEDLDGGGRRRTGRSFNLTGAGNVLRVGAVNVRSGSRYSSC